MNTALLQFDAVVVGSGPGGATAARELSQRNKQVLIPAWGSRAPIKGSRWHARMFVEEAVMNGAVFINRAKVEKAIVENGKAAGCDFCCGPLIAAVGTVERLKEGREPPMAPGVHMEDEGSWMTARAAR